VILSKVYPFKAYPSLLIPTFLSLLPYRLAPTILDLWSRMSLTLQQHSRIPEDLVTVLKDLAIVTRVLRFKSRMSILAAISLLLRLSGDAVSFFAFRCLLVLRDRGCGTSSSSKGDVSRTLTSHFRRC
jgi:hypothetical protein